MKTYYVYIMTNRTNSVLYTGVTNDLERRAYEHQNKLIDGFTRKYNVTKLVYYEETNDVTAAIDREKQIKGWLRKRKQLLVESVNPSWKNLGQWNERDSSPSAQNDTRPSCHPEGEARRISLADSSEPMGSFAGAQDDSKRAQNDRRQWRN